MIREDCKLPAFEKNVGVFYCFINCQQLLIIRTVIWLGFNL